MLHLESEGERKGGRGILTLTALHDTQRKKRSMVRRRLHTPQESTTDKRKYVEKEKTIATCIHAHSHKEKENHDETSRQQQ
jgi:hypothetical protein